MTLEIMVNGNWMVANTDITLASNVDRNLRAGIAAGTHQVGVAYEGGGMMWRMV